jgi:dephospho-CoA kinase
MLRIGITGCIGSGKSTVARIFEHLNIPVYNADLRAKQLMTESPAIRQGLLHLFGTEAYLPSGELNRTNISQQVFAKREMLEKLNALVHPVVIKDFDDWSAAQTGAPYVMKEAALMFESDSYKQLDAVITVASPENLRIERTMNRDGLDKESVLARMRNQMTEEEKVTRSQYVIYNNEHDAVIPQALALHKRFMEL